MPMPVRTSIEKSLQVDLGAVRVHTDTGAHTENKNLSARAFTYGNNIFLGKGESPANVGLMAHEAAHVVQQQGAPKVQKWSSSNGTDSFENEAHRASAAVLSGQTFSVNERTSGAKVQRFGISDLIDYFADKANNIPGYRMFTVIIGVNPINMETVERTPANIFRAAIELIPGGKLITDVLEKHGLLEKGADWVATQFKKLAMVGQAFVKAIEDFIDDLGWSDLLHPFRLWEKAKRIVLDPVEKIIDFVVGLVDGIIELIKKAILIPLAKLAEGTAGWDLLCAVLGKNPITGDPVPRTAETLIGGFMKLIHQEEIWENIKKANALSRAWAWFNGAVDGLIGFVKEIPSLFIDALKSLELVDILILPKAFIKIGKVFLGFLGRFFSWAGEQVWSLLEIIFAVVAPSVMPYLKKAAAAFRSILKNPIGFVGNLVKAAKQGFQLFSSHFLEYLKKALIGWLTGTLEGANIYIPQGFSLMEIIKFVLSVLGLTWQNIRQKLVKVIGETAVKALEVGFDLVVTLVRDGPAAAWQKIVEGVSNLKEMVIDGIIGFVKDRIVTAAVTKLLSMLNPAGAFIQAIIAIYNTVMFFIERLKQIGQVVAAFIDSLSAIANGIIGPASQKVADTLGGLLTLVISFLARLVGLGKVGDAVKNIVDKIRAPIDKALDRVIAWIVEMATKAGKFLTKKGAAPGQEPLPDDTFAIDGETHRISIRMEPGAQTPMISSDPISIRDFLNRIERDESIPAPQRALVPAARTTATMLERLGADAASGRLAGAELQTLKERIRSYEEQLALAIQRILSGVDSDSADDRKYRAEGLVGSFSAMEGLQRGDKITPDHQPQNKLFERAAVMPEAVVSGTPARLFGPDSNMAAHAAGRTAAGYCINLHENRHKAGRTFGGKSQGTLASAQSAINGRISRFPVDLTKSPQEVERSRALQRREVVGVIRNEMTQDVSAMRSVAGKPENDPVWVDIPNLPNRSVFDGKKVKKARLIERIRQQINAGESQVESQDLDRLRY